MEIRQGTYEEKDIPWGETQRRQRVYKEINEMFQKREWLSWSGVTVRRTYITGTLIRT